MIYFQAKKDLHFLQQFRAAVLSLWRIEGAAYDKLRGHSPSLSSALLDNNEWQRAMRSQANQDNSYQQTRESIARSVLRASRIADHCGVPIHLKSFPAPALGGPVIPVDLFQVILQDNSHGGIDKQIILDAINQTLGESEARVARERGRLINPFYWIKEGLVFIIRIPFMLFNASGFDVTKIEDHFISKVFKLAEVIAIAYILVRLGMTTEQISKLLDKLF